MRTKAAGFNRLVVFGRIARMHVVETGEGVSVHLEGGRRDSYELPIGTLVLVTGELAMRRGIAFAKVQVIEIIAAAPPAKPAIALAGRRAEHAVVEHPRVLGNGKIITVKAHRRGRRSRGGK